MAQRPHFYLEESIAGHCTPTGLIRAEGSVQIVVVGSAFQVAAPLFSVRAENFHFEAGFKGKEFYIIRNGQTLTYPEPIKLAPDDLVFCGFNWSPTVIDGWFGFNKHELVNIKMKTPPTVPPFSLLRYIRAQNVTPKTEYNSVAELHLTVSEALESIKDKTALVGSDAFWDVQYERGLIISRRPKRETHIHPTVHALIHDIALAKNLEIVPEYPVGGGCLDFLITGTLKSGERASIAVEFKLAHSRDVGHGLTHQLPTYMKVKGCDRGIYCVLYFRGLDFDEPHEFEAPQRMQIDLMCQLLPKGLDKQIQILMLNVSRKPSPSVARHQAG
jgi:hypothetical protein